MKKLFVYFQIITLAVIFSSAVFSKTGTRKVAAREIDTQFRFRSMQQAWICGSWEGTGFQLNSTTTWHISFNANCSGQKYSIAYPTLSCGGYWELVKVDSNNARFIERLQYGKNRCLDNGVIIITKVNNKHISFSHFVDENRLVAFSTLVKTK
ncbi:MAG: hypothetical protein GY754_42590 [bacterium]|nr:hypothetical protein [bacterium]